MKHSPEAMKLFYHGDGSPYRLGEILKIPALAKSLRMIAEQGNDAFYRGEIAEAIVADMAAHGGIITMEDLDRYRPAVRTPVKGTYERLEVYACSRPPDLSNFGHWFDNKPSFLALF